MKNSTVRPYELMFILSPDKGTKEREEIFQHIKNDLSDKNAEITHTDEWPLRAFCYQIGKFTEGYYFIVNFTCEPAHIGALNKLFRLNTDILRHVIMLTPEEGYHFFEYEKDKDFYLGEGPIQIKQKDEVDEIKEEAKEEPKKETVKKTEKTEEVKETEKTEAKDEKEEPVEEPVESKEEKEETTEEKTEPTDTKEEKKEEVVEKEEKKEEKEDEEEKSDEERLKELDKKLDQLLLDD